MDNPLPPLQPEVERFARSLIRDHRMLVSDGRAEREKQYPDCWAIDVTGGSQEECGLILRAAMQFVAQMRSYAESARTADERILGTFAGSFTFDGVTVDTSLTDEQLRLAVRALKETLPRGGSAVSLPADSWIERAFIAALAASGAKP